MQSESPLTYRDAGVDIAAKTAAFRGLKSLVGATTTPGVLAEVGGFGGLFHLGAVGMRDPVLVASADGVGTKLKLAFMLNRHDTVGIDIVNHCINDILVQGARPLFFLDYIASGRLDPGVIRDVVAGLATACRAAGCALLGGETAEMPGFYADGEYDLAGFIVGAVERDRVITGEAVRPSDVLIGLESSGLHTNGYSLARKALLERAVLRLDDSPLAGRGDGRTLGEILLEPHRLYAPQVLPLLEDGLVHGMAHITGGGFTDNIPRVLPEGCHAVVERGSWPVPPLFALIQESAGVDVGEMHHVFNMGIGFILIVPSETEEDVTRRLGAAGETPHTIGRVVSGDRGVTIR
jgi:phosphoribosylformylglycinamidine cyclo-ligase